MNDTSHSCSYEIDGDSRIVDVDDAWFTFGRENGYSIDTREQLLGMDIRHAISGWITVELYEEIFRRLRDGAAQAQLRFRCDSPEQRRFMKMQVVGMQGGHLRFTSSVLRTEPRPSVPMLDPKVRRNGQWHIACSVCLRLQGVDGAWREIEEAVSNPHAVPKGGLPALSYTVCPECQNAMRQAVRDDPA